MLRAVGIRSSLMRSGSTQSHRANYRISMCRVREVGFRELAIAMAAALSSYAMLAASCGTPRSHMILRTYRSIFPQSATSMNLPLVDDCATFGCKRDFQAIVPPARRKQAPPKECRVFGQVPHSESIYQWRNIGSCEGRPSRRRSCALLLMFGGGTYFRSLFGVSRQ